MKKIIPIMVILLFLSTCKTIDEDWLTPAWIQEKIDYLSGNCIYKGSWIHEYEWDSVNYVVVYIPNDWWADQEVYYENGDQVEWEDSVFTYYNFRKYYLTLKSDEYKEIWAFSDDNCPD